MLGRGLRRFTRRVFYNIRGDHPRVRGAYYDDGSDQKNPATVSMPRLFVGGLRADEQRARNICRLPCQRIDASVRAFTQLRSSRCAGRFDDAASVARRNDKSKYARAVDGDDRAFGSNRATGSRAWAISTLTRRAVDRCAIVPRVIVPRVIVPRAIVPRSHSILGWAGTAFKHRRLSEGHGDPLRLAEGTTSDGHAEFATGTHHASAVVFGRLAGSSAFWFYGRFSCRVPFWRAASARASSHGTTAACQFWFERAASFRSSTSATEQQRWCVAIALCGVQRSTFSREQRRVHHWSRQQNSRPCDQRWQHLTASRCGRVARQRLVHARSRQHQRSRVSRTQGRQSPHPRRRQLYLM